MTAGTETKSAPLFREVGASWYWVLVGPLSAAAMLWIEKSNGYGWQISVPALFLVLVTSFIALQVKAARIHTSVELTNETLRQGTETIKVAEIVKVYPAPDHPLASEKELERWQSARALGELVGGAQGPDRHRSATHRRAHRASVGASTPAPACRADPAGRGAGRTEPVRPPEPRYDDGDTDTGSRR